MIRHVFLDIDNTLLDFDQAEAVAIRKTFETLGLPIDEAGIARYHQINIRQWQRLDLGEITREQVLYGRFEILFRELGLTASARQTEDTYRHYLGIGHFFVPGAPAALAYLKEKYSLYIASNGMARTQYSRLDSAGISSCFQEIFISDTVGSHKPEQEYFDYCFSRIPGFLPDQAIIIGDNLHSDILGGLRAGIHTCWYNRKNLAPEPDIVPEYTITDWSQIQTVL